ncbi:MAG: hypothetical protein ACUVX9_13410 [Anaerolineae bacterium]
MAEGLLARVRCLLQPGPEEAAEEAAGPRPQMQPAAEHVQPRVLMIVHDPPVASEGGRRLHEVFGWSDPGDLARQYAADLREASGGYVDYQVAERIDADWFPPKVDGFRYTEDSYVRAWRTRSFHQPDAIDYPAQVSAFDLLGRHQRGELDEVWFFAFPYSGDYESTMAGRGAFWLNSPPVPGTESDPRRLVIMAFNYERGVGEMLENFCHRVESIMPRVYDRLGRGRDLWRLFTLYDREAPGRAHCGNAHFAPNSLRDYDWGNRRPVRSYCDDWYTFPEMPGRARTVDCEEWGCGDIRAHHRWWLAHIPHAEGETDGVSNNWWRYIVDPNELP